MNDFSRMRRTAVTLLRRSSVFAIDTTTEEHCLPEDGQTVALVIFRNSCFFDKKSCLALPKRHEKVFSFQSSGSEISTSCFSKP